MNFYKNYFGLSKTEAIAKGFASEIIPINFRSKMKKLLRAIIENDDEPILFRSHAKYYRMYYDDDDSFRDQFLKGDFGRNTIMKYYEDITDMCDSLTLKERDAALVGLDLEDINQLQAGPIVDGRREVEDANQLKVGPLMDNLKKVIKSSVMQGSNVLAVGDGDEIINLLQEVLSLPKLSTKRWLYFFTAMNYFMKKFALSKEDAELRGIVMIRLHFCRL
jgi:hypothetical protein